MYEIHLIGQASIATWGACPPALSNLFYIEQALNKKHTPQRAQVALLDGRLFESVFKG